MRIDPVKHIDTNPDPELDFHEGGQSAVEHLTCAIAMVGNLRSMAGPLATSLRQSRKNAECPEKLHLERFVYGGSKKRFCACKQKDC